MTTEEAYKLIADAHERRSRAVDRLIEPARAAMRALKDAGLSNSALALEEIFFDLDRADQDGRTVFNDHPEAAALATMMMLTGVKPK